MAFAPAADLATATTKVAAALNAPSWIQRVASLADVTGEPSGILTATGALYIRDEYLSHIICSPGEVDRRLCERFKEHLRNEKALLRGQGRRSAKTLRLGKTGIERRYLAFDAERLRQVAGLC